MAVQITITINEDSKADRIAEAFDSEFPGRTETGLTKRQWVKQQLVAYIKQVTRNYEANAAASTARQTKETEVNSIEIT
jgi:hypothetical protein